MTDSLLPRIYTSRDTDAPTLTSEDPTSMIHVLSKVLIEGYGDQPSLGWEKQERDDGKQVAFRSTVPGRDICWLWVNSDDPDRNSREVVVRGGMGFEGWDDNGEPEADQWFGAEGKWWRVGRSNGEGELDWLILGNSYFFYIFIAPEATSGTLAYALSQGNEPDDDDGYASTLYCFGSLFGDFADPAVAIINSTDETSTFGNRHASYSEFLGLDENTEFVRLSVSPAGSINEDARFHSMSRASGYNAGRRDYERPYPSETGLLTSPISVSSPHGIVGMLPGMKVPHHYLRGYFIENASDIDYRFDFLPDDGGDRFFVAPSSADDTNQSRTPIYLIDMLEGW